MTLASLLAERNATEMALRVLMMSRVIFEARHREKELKGAEVESRGNRSRLRMLTNPYELGKKCATYVGIQSRSIDVGIATGLCVKIVLDL